MFKFLTIEEKLRAEIAENKKLKEQQQILEDAVLELAQIISEKVLEEEE